VSSGEPERLDLLATLRSTGAVREFQDRPVDRAALARVLDTARFAPNGGNQQAWRVVAVEDPGLRAGLRDLYVDGWVEYLAQRAEGVQPWAPIGDRDAEAAAIQRGRDRQADPATAIDPGGFAAGFDRVPVLLVVLADLRLLAATDRDLGRYTLVGGASVYPFVWSILLAARAEGLGGVLTTMTTLREPQVKQLLGVPDEFAVAAVLALGHPVDAPTRLRRGPVEEFATVDTFDGPPIGPA
jgi:nitroreductase